MSTEKREYNHELGEYLYVVMIYAGVAILHFYRNDLVPFKEGETFGVILEKNKDLMKRVDDEVCETFKYSLSDIQKCKIIEAYCAPGQSVHTTQVYKRKEPLKGPDLYSRAA